MERSVKKCFCIARQVSDCISLHSRAGEWVKGLFIITGRMEIKDHEIQEHLEFYIKPDIAYISTNIDFPVFFFLKCLNVCLSSRWFVRMAIINTPTSTAFSSISMSLELMKNHTCSLLSINLIKFKTWKRNLLSLFWFRYINPQIQCTHTSIHFYYWPLQNKFFLYVTNSLRNTVV